MTAVDPAAAVPAGIAKTPTGIAGLDAITGGGLPSGRPTLVCGGPGCGKAVLGMQFLVRGVRDHGEPGLFVSFEERPADLVANFASMDFGVEALVAEGLIGITHIELTRNEIVETGPFTLDALRIRIEQGLRTVGAKRVVIDSMDSVFSALSSTELLRFEVGRLLEWLKRCGVTAIITGERGSSELTRHGFEAYVSDCVVLLDHRVAEQLTTRRLRVVKYRGAAHEQDEFPFLIDQTGATVPPITSLDLNYEAPSDRISTGVADLDAMVGGGYFRSTTVLVTGKAGSGKSSLAASFAAAVCGRGERCLYVALEESPAQLTRNMRSIGIDLQPALDEGLLEIQAFRPTARGLEGHLVTITATVDRLAPSCVVIDPITNFVSVGDTEQVRSMLARIVHHLKSIGVTLVLTALTPGSGYETETETAVSSLTDTWVALGTVPIGSTRRRELRVVKSRGVEHSVDDHELIISAGGLSLRALEEVQA